MYIPEHSKELQRLSESYTYVYSLPAAQLHKEYLL